MRKARTLQLELLEDRILMAADPAATIDLPAADFINQNFNFSVDFDNASTTPTDVGYGPYFDLHVPPGVDINSAAYLGNSVSPTDVGVFPAGGTLTHPLTGQTINGTPGEHLYVFELPFGSFVPNQPIATIDISATLDKPGGATVGSPLGMKAQGGFRYGADPLNNPATDAPIQGSLNNASITPQVINLTKTVAAPEAETATGPNFPRTYSLTLDIANGETVTDIVLSDLLPANLIYVNGSIAVNAAGAGASSGIVVTDSPTPGVPNNLPTNDFRIDIASVTGSASASDIVVTYQAYVPNLDANAASVIDPASGDDALSVNQAQVSGTYSGSAVSDNDSATDFTLNDRSIAVQKSVAVVGGGALIPGAVLQYTLNFQISDYFSFDQVVLDDVFSDGQRFDATFTPTFSVSEEGVATAGNFGGGNFTVTLNADNNPATPASDGSTAVQFRLSDELISRALDGVLDGDLSTNLIQTSGTTGSIVFRTVVQEAYSDTFPSGDPSLDQGDVLDNDVTITGRIPSSGQTENDTSATELTLDALALDKTIYAVNGVIGAPATISPGQTITYRLVMTLPSEDVEDLVLKDFLPLPVFDATEVTSFSSAISAAVPAAGTAKFGPTQTASNIGSPTVSASSTGNLINFDFGTHDVVGSTSKVIDILFTVTATDQPFADGLFLSNQAQILQGTTQLASLDQVDIIQVELRQPELNLTKGVVSTDAASPVFSTSVGPVSFTAPGSVAAPFSGGSITSAGLDATPINANLRGIDAGDLVKFAIVVENTGGADAFDVRITDDLPAGFQIPGSGTGLNLQIYNGAGTGPLSFSGIAADLFSTGIVIDDSGAQGAIDNRITGTAGGENILILTYDLQAMTSINPASQIVNTAEIAEFSAIEGGNDFTAGNTGPWSDTATVTAASPSTAKSLVGTGISGTNNGAAQAVIGETAQYSVTVTLPEGQIQTARVVDQLEQGLAFASLDSVSASSGVSSTIGAFATTASFTPTTTGNGSTGAQTLSFDFGTLTNANSSNGSAETLTLTYTVRVVNIAGNQAATQLDNSARFSWDPDGAGPGSTQTSSPASAAVTVVEPQVNTAKAVTVGGSGSSGDAGDSVSYSLTFSVPAGSPEAFEVTLSDAIPSPILSPSITAVTDSASTLTLGDFQIVGSTLSLVAAGGIDMAPGRTITVTIGGSLSNTVTPGQTITNTAGAAWSSIDGSDPNERTGAGGVNDYTSSANATITIASPAATKSIVATSETHTSDSGAGTTGDPRMVAVGEIVRFRLAVQLPEGTSSNVQLLENLPTGMRFLNDGTAKVAFVSNGGGITSSANGTAGVGAITDGSAFISGNAATAPVFVLADSAVSTSATANANTYNSGTDVRFKLGTLLNSDSDADAEFVVVEFNALVDNSASGSNDAGDNRDNTFNPVIDGTSFTASNTVRARIAEPSLSLAKTITTTPTDAGDSIVYQLVLSNASGANVTTGFDLRLLDVLDDHLDLATISDVVVVSKPVTTNVTNNSNAATDTVDLSIDQLGAGESITVTVTATVEAAVSAGENLDNTATLTGTSLPGPNGTTSNPTGSSVTSSAGTDFGERDGSGSPSHNDLRATASAPTVTVAAPVIDKLTPADTTYVVGETVTYDILVTLPEGTTAGVLVADDLPLGLSYVSHQIITTAALSGGNLSADFGATLPSPTVTAPGGSGGDFSLNFGTVTVNGDNVTTNNRFLVKLTARVDDVPSTVLGTTLTNQANLQYTNPNGGGTTTVDDPTDPVVTIQQPLLSIDKEFYDATNTSRVATINPGVTLTVRLAVENTGTSDAFDVVIRDALDATVFDVNSVVFTTTPGGFTPANTAGALSWSGGTVTDGSGPISFEFQVNVLPSLTLGQFINNTARVSEASTLPGVVPGERDVSGAQDTDRLLIPPAIEKDILSTSASATAGTNVAIGETISYRLTVSLGEGTTDGPVIVTDRLPLTPGVLSLVSAQVATIGASVTGSVLSVGASGTVSDTNSDGLNDQVSFNFGTLTNGSTNGDLGPEDQITIDVVARVENRTANQAGDALTNVTTMNYGSATLTDSATVTVVEPELSFGKTIVGGAPTRLDAGDHVQFALAVDHAAGSTANAQDLTLTDLVDGGSGRLTIVSIDSIGGTNADGLTTADFVITGGGTGLAFAPGRQGAYDLGLTNDFTLIYTVEVGVGATPGVSLTNGASVNWTSLDGSSGAERNGADGPGGSLNDYAAAATQTLQVSAGPPLDFDKSILTTSDSATGSDQLTAGVPDLAIGETVTYRLSWYLSEGTTPNLVLLDQLPFSAGVLEYLSSQVASIGANLTGSALSVGAAGTASDTNADGTLDSIRFAFGTIANAPDNVVDAGDRIEVDVTARVANVAANQTGTTLTNTGSLQYDTAAGTATLTDTTTTEVVEPLLGVTKTADDTTPTFGQTVTYTVVLAHQSGSAADAHDIVIRDTLPAGLTYIAGSASLPGVDVDASGAPVIEFRVASLSLATGSTQFTYQAKLGALGEVSLAQGLTNQQAIAWTSQTGSATGERTGAGGVDDYTTSAQSTVTVATPDYRIAKTDRVSEVAPLDRITWQISVSNQGNQAGTGVVVVDTFDKDLMRNVTASNGGVVDNQAGTVTWTLPSLAVGEQIELSVTGTLRNPVPVGTAQLVNSVTVQDDGVNGPDLTPENNSATDIDTVQNFVFDSSVNGVNDFQPQTGGGPIFGEGSVTGGGTTARPGVPRIYLPSSHDWGFGSYLHFTTPPLPVDPFYSGAAEPGTTLTITLYDRAGAMIAWQTVMADAGGNWVAGFPGITLGDHPHSFTVQQTAAPYNDSTPGGFNLRTYFAPALYGPNFFSQAPSIDGVFGRSAYHVLDAMHQQNIDPLRSAWDDFAGYEFLTPSTTPTQYAG